MTRALIVWIVCCFIFINNAKATHNRAGEITYQQISDYTYEVTIVTYTNTKLTSEGLRPADRTELEIQWGDNTYSTVPRVIINALPDDYQLNVYKAQHTYAGPGTFELFVEDPNRNEGVDNIPNSINVIFSIKTILQINPFLGFNNTPILLNPPIDKAGVNKVFIHNPAAFDPDGDSLSFELTVCTGEDGEPIPSYTLPESSNRPIFIDPIEGNLTWDAPVKAGKYNIAFNIIEWRMGVRIGQISRDMQIDVFDTDNNPPLIDSIIPICVEAGENAQFTISAFDNTEETVSMWATGGAFQVENPAVFETVSLPGKATGTFTWNTKCDHLRKQPYQVVVKAQDNNSEVVLVNQQTIYISVIAPAPKNLVTNASNNTIELNWENYTCSNNKGFNVYRSTKSVEYIADSCSYGVPESTGFELIASISNSEATNYIDNNNSTGMVQGYQYCYMVTAYFEDDYESKPSFEACTELVRGTPIITNVSVEKHDHEEGEIYIAWSKPIDFDTIEYPGPLSYIVKRAEGIWGADYIALDTLIGINDTIYHDLLLNTITTAYNYQIEIHNPEGLTELPMTASSIYLEFAPSNKKLDIQFVKNTPWVNSEYIIYKEDPLSNTFDSIGNTSAEHYIDNNLINGNEYCYQIKSIGAYDLGGIIKPIINNSHRNCGIPIDTTPPIPPVLSIASNCEEYTNTLSWDLADPNDDISAYYIYFSPNASDDLSIIDSVLSFEDNIYIHNLNSSPSGCYAVTAIDSALNESELSNIMCIDDCKYYELPNVFTPNGDNSNDYFSAITPHDVIENNVDRIDCKIYSRWGNLVYETTDPFFKWDGKSKNNNKTLGTGVYYYVCDVYEKRISGIEPRYLVGFVHLFTDGENNSAE